MNIQSVNGTDSWVQFVRLVQEARSRSRGIGGGAYPVSGPAPGAQVHPQAPAGSKYGIVRSEQPTAAGPPRSGQARAIGHFFDAYA